MAGILLNFIEVTLSANELQLLSLAQNAVDIKKLRETHGTEYNFYARDGHVYYWPRIKSVSSDLNGALRTVTKKDNPQIFSKIIECAVVDLFESVKAASGENSYKVFRKNAQHTWNFISSRNELNGIVGGLAAYRKISYHPFFLKPKDNIVLGFTMACSLDMKFLWKRDELIAQRINTGMMGFDESDNLIPNLQNIYYFLEATGSKSRYDTAIEKLEGNEVTCSLLKKVTEWLSKNKGELILPVGLQVEKFTLNYLPNNGIEVGEIYAPKRYFYNNATNIQRLPYYNDQVKTYKPFSFGLFEDKTVRIAVVFPSQYQGTTETFLNTLRNSLQNDLHLNKVEFVPIKVADTSVASYKKGLYENNDDLKSCDLAIIIVNEAHESLSANESPYFVCKAKLIGQGLPTQDIQIETIQNRIHPLVLSNISLNIYAKLGGTAWTIEKEEKLKDELVIGVGSTKSANGRNILGIAQIFHPDGRYIVGNCSPLSTFENYSKNLEEYLYETLSQIIEAHINTSKSFRLIFHLYKSASEQYEITAIENVIKRFDNYSFDYALLHLGYGHNFRLYADDGKGKLKKGSYVQITPYMALLHFVPTSVLPLKIEIDIRSKGFNDLFYLSKQVYWFSNLSHRSYNPSKKTVTIMYPSLMALLTEKLSLVEGWNYDMLGYVRDKQWFI